MATQQNAATQRTTADESPLGTAVDEAIGNAADQIALREAVAAYVAAAKTVLTPPQDVIVALKSQLQRDALPHLGPTHYAALVSQVVGWGIEEYYGAKRD